MQNVTFITFMVSEKILMLDFLTSPDTSSTKNMDIIFLEHTPELHNSYYAWT